MSNAAPGGETMTPERVPITLTYERCGQVINGRFVCMFEIGHGGECRAHVNLNSLKSSTPTRAATDAEIGEHHWRDGLRFKRLENGNVRMRRDANVIATIPAAEWESIVREVESANRANGTALDGRLIASEVAGSALNEKERIALDWVIRDNDLAARGEEVGECNADEASAMYAVANTLRGLRDRLTGAPNQGDAK
jgi:hypothetical protein